MVGALASNRSDQSFGEAVLPRRAWSNRFVADAHGSQSLPDGSAVDLIPIADQVARRLIPGERLRDLARDPVRGRMMNSRRFIRLPRRRVAGDAKAPRY